MPSQNLPLFTSHHIPLKVLTDKTRRLTTITAQIFAQPDHSNLEHFEPVSVYVTYSKSRITFNDWVQNFATGQMQTE